jgi:hypothetical protein
MKYEVYSRFTITDDFSIFDFVSTGRKGEIAKRIEFTPTEIPTIINLAFGDIDENGQIDDHSISNNGDRNKILATIAFVVEIYLQKYPDRLVYFKGSTQDRTRLYRIALSLNLDELQQKFEIYAEMSGGITYFVKDMDVEGILVKRKK